MDKITDCSLGVGDGSGQLFVYGDYVSIKTCQEKLLRLEEVEGILNELAALGSLTPNYDSGTDHRAVCRKYKAYLERKQNG